MHTSNITSSRPALGRIVLIVLGCAFSLALAQAPALKAADSIALQPLADKALSMPLTFAFEKVLGAEHGPYVLKLTNTSKDALKVGTKILLSVAFHAESKAKILPEHVIEAGQMWTIPGLAAQDRVILTAQGFTPLEVTVP
jgi:hypothetical protein